MDCTRFGNKLTYYREKNEMTEKELARKLHISVRDLERLELSEKEPSPMLISRISNLFGVDFSKYLDMDEKHSGAHHFDVDDPEYSPLTTQKVKQTKRIVKEKKKYYRKPAEADKVKKTIAKFFLALVLLAIVFIEDLVDMLPGVSAVIFRFAGPLIMLIVLIFIVYYIKRR